MPSRHFAYLYRAVMLGSLASGSVLFVISLFGMALGHYHLDWTLLSLGLMVVGFCALALW